MNYAQTVTSNSLKFYFTIENPLWIIETKQRHVHKLKGQKKINQSKIVISKNKITNLTHPYNYFLFDLNNAHTKINNVHWEQFSRFLNRRETSWIMKSVYELYGFFLLFCIKQGGLHFAQNLVRFDLYSGSQTRGFPCRLVGPDRGQTWKLYSDFASA